MPPNKYITALNFYLDRFKETNDPQAAIEIANLIVSGKLRCTPRMDSKILYMPSKFSGKCSKCDKFYLNGDYIFIQNGKGWHFACATEQEKLDCEFYQAFLKRQQSFKEDIGLTDEP
jgi:hypothetical protein